jgi:hypothetical protein
MALPSLGPESKTTCRDKNRTPDGTLVFSAIVSAPADSVDGLNRSFIAPIDRGHIDGRRFADTRD